MATIAGPATITAVAVDPKELGHNDKAGADYRDYTQANSKFFDRVSEFYHKNHKFQTVEFNKQIRERYLKLDKRTMNIWEAFEMLEEIVDESDPDTDSPQIVHAFQTAEALRKKYPEHGWLHLAGFIHDLGKITAHPKFGNDPQWCVVGDTFPVGCKHSDKCVYPEYFKENPDHEHPLYSSDTGIYTPNCGLDKLTMSWGHDEYMYQVCVGNNCTLPQEALYVIRFHSFYPWHANNGYKHLMSEQDDAMLTWVRAFQKCDLYSKSDNPEDKPDPAKLRPYYESLINKYFPTPVLRW